MGFITWLRTQLGWFTQAERDEACRKYSRDVQKAIDKVRRSRAASLRASAPKTSAEGSRPEGPPSIA